MASMAAVLPAALRRGVAEVTPRDNQALIEYAGGRRELVQLLSGLDHAPRRSEYRTEQQHKAAQLRWRAAQRRVQRGATEAGERRTITLTPGQKRVLTRRVNMLRLERFRREGARVRMKATVNISSGQRADLRPGKVMPSGGPMLSMDMSGTIETHRATGGWGAAADVFTRDFLDEYGMPPNAWISDVDWLRVRLPGEPEGR